MCTSGTLFVTIFEICWNLKKKFKSCCKTACFWAICQFFEYVLKIIFFFNICILYIIMILCRDVRTSIRISPKNFQVRARNWHIFPASKLLKANFCLFFSSKMVPQLIMCLLCYNQFIISNCSKSTVDVTYRLYFGFVIIIFGEKYRKNGENRIRNFKSKDNHVFLL